MELAFAMVLMYATVAAAAIWYRKRTNTDPETTTPANTPTGGTN